MQTVRWIGFAFGISILGATATSVVRTLVVPRGLSSTLSRASERATRGFFMLIAGRATTYKRKDRILAFQGPVSLLVMLATWGVLFLGAYALMLWPFVRTTFPSALRMAGSAMFTLGFSAPHGTGQTTLQYLAAATGLVIVALQIAYLPTLYAAFNRRETMVTVLATRAGLPAWGPEILARHQAVKITDSLKDLYDDWERWAADVAESHSNYPVLVHFRSPHPLRNWLLGLLAVMDSAAMYLALCPTAAPSQARLCLRMGFVSLRDIARALGIEFDADPLPTDPLSLTKAEFLEGVARVEGSGMAIERSGEEAWPHFHGWRVNYEALSYEMLDLVNAPPAAWSGPRAHVPPQPIPLRAPVDRRHDDARSLEQARSDPLD